MPIDENGKYMDINITNHVFVVRTESNNGIKEAKKDVSKCRLTAPRFLCYVGLGAFLLALLNRSAYILFRRDTK